MSRLISSICAACAAIAIAGPAAAQAEDWANSLYTEEGIELRADERVFTLFAALNEMGLDEAPVARTQPVPKRQYDPVRQLVRDSVNIDPALRSRIDAFFDKHPLPLATYTAYVLTLGSAPGFAAPEKPAPQFAQLAGFEQLLAEFHKSAKIGSLFDKVQPQHREALKRWQAVVDAPIERARGILKAPETDDSPRLIVVLNLLDGRGAGYGFTHGDETLLVVGPDDTEAPDARPIAKAFARAELQSAAEAGHSGLKSGSALLTEVHNAGYGVGAATVADYVAENLARTVAIRAATANGEIGRALEAEKRSGFVLVSEFNRGLAIYAKSNKPMPAFLADFLREIDTASFLAQLRGN